MGITQPVDFLRTNPMRVRWLDLHNLDWKLRLDHEIPSNEHLTTWTDLAKRSQLPG
jgi:hypothetical protein